MNEKERLALEYGFNIPSEIYNALETYANRLLWKSEVQRAFEAGWDAGKQGDNGNQSWKPSKEQIHALEFFVRSIAESGYASPYDNNTKLLVSLLHDLEKHEKQEEQNIANSAKTCKIGSKIAEWGKVGMQPIQLYEKALKTYGIASQKWVLIEECGELIDAFAKAERGRAETEHLLEELADVSIMVGQMALAIDFEGFQEKRAEKLLRLYKRLEDKNKQNDNEE